MKTKEIKIQKAGKLFTVTKYPLPTFPTVTGVYIVEINDGAMELVGGKSPEKFESYLRKSFRHFYNLDKKLKTRTRSGRAKINTL